MRRTSKSIEVATLWGDDEGRVRVLPFNCASALRVGQPDAKDNRMPETRTPETIDEYIAGYPREVQTILKKIRRTVKLAAPEARERISYRIPTFTLDGVLIHFAAFRNHIGVYPPVRGNATLEKAVARFAGEKGNLRFPLDQQIPYDLIARIVKFKVKQNRAHAVSRNKTGRKPSAG